MRKVSGTGLVIVAADERSESDSPDVRVNWAEDLGASGESGVRYVLRWETLPENRDRPRTGELPPPSALRLYKLRSVP